MKAWGGRFKANESELMEAFNESISFDKRLYREDIRGSIAYSKALLKAGFLSKKEQQDIECALKKIEKEIEDGEFEFSVKDEDIHMAIEKRLIELTTSAGAKIHTGRSRNDQVATDVRLYMKRKIADIHALIINLLKTVKSRAEELDEVIMPGYTHLQQAQPILYSHYLCAFAFEIIRDYERLCDCEKRVDIMPLGSGAIAGNAFDIDREFLREELGFLKISENSIDAVSDRDFIAEMIFVCSMLLIHTSKFAEDGVVFSSKEFGFYELDDRYSTGSSMMPQKKNPDSFELIRGKTGRVSGNLVQLLMIQKGTPYGYNKDLQEDKEGLFDTIDTTEIVLRVLERVVATTKIKSKRMADDLDKFIYATDIADYLVKKGVPFRDAHKITGEIVGYAVEQNASLDKIELEQYKRYSVLFEKDVYSLFDPESSVNLRNIYGGTGKKSVKNQINQIDDFIKSKDKTVFSVEK